MNVLRILLIFLFSIFCITGRSQITFIADTIEGCDSLRVTFTYIYVGPVDTISTVEWDFGNGDSAAGKEPQTITYDSAATYSPFILLNGNTIISRPGYIRVHASPDARFLWSDSLELGYFTVLLRNVPQATDSIMYNYEWQLEDGGRGDTPLLIHRFPAAGSYSAGLRVTHPFGCSDQRQRLVTVKDSLVCPNVFSPNNDGINDFFIVGSNGVTPYSLQVFSKSGILVYQTEAPTIIWDGRNLSGQKMNTGIYYYIIRPAGGSAGYEKRGFITLYR